MSISVDVHLLSGMRAAVEVEADASVELLKLRAQSALAVPNKCRLLNSSGEVLDGAQTVTEAELRSGDVLTLHVNQVQIKANRQGGRFAAFSALLGDGSVVTWGKATTGGDSSAVQEQLRDVQQIQASGGAFAAVRSGGSVVTWGDTDYGGDSRAVQEQLRDVQQIQASCGAFAAIRSDGSVVTWGRRGCGGDSRAVQDQLRDVQQIQASDNVFAAILGDGSVVTWGYADHGGDSSAVQEQLRDVQQIQASNGAFAAIRSDGSVVTWGDTDYGGDSRAVQIPVCVAASSAFEQLGPHADAGIEAFVEFRVLWKSSPETFLDPVNTAARQTLYSVDDTPLDTKGTAEPVLKLGRRSRQEAKTTFQVVSGITDDILSVNRAVDAGARVVFDAAGSYIEWEDGSRADFIRSGRQASNSTAGSPARGYPEVTWDLKTRDSLREVLLAFERVEPPFFEVTSRKDWDDEEGWNRDRWRSRNWWETAEEDQHWSWQQDTWQQDGQEWDQHQSWQYEAWGQDSQDPADPWQGWEGVAAWNERQAAKSDSTRRPRSPAQEPASGSRAREDPPRKKGRAWWERPPPEYHWKDGEWKKKNTRGTRSAQKQAERIERGQKRRLENPHREREAPPAPEAPAIPEEESSEESLDTGAPPVVLREAPAPLEPVDEEAAESTSESSSSSSEDEPEPLPAAASSAVSQQAERIRAVRLESSESEGKPSGPFSPSPPRDPRVPPVRLRNKAAREEPPKKAAKRPPRRNCG
ncbi:E3 ubiquitin-protein ligase HERC2 [Symbiodinium microadriaticum]|uniref:E3 ubiquitin-protein ligase HERC2 n=1 Tax=Symbiodinium microadriaticum TaxID=2951 RepID=A0A1Q9C4B4_SYMMI|nr:E3 ubiquitin-protein ligase HERC2 [Symbiodinium microadriaticum]